MSRIAILDHLGFRYYQTNIIQSVFVGGTLVNSTTPNVTSLFFFSFPPSI